MRILLLPFTFILALSWTASAHDQCDQKAIRKAIAQIKNSPKAKSYALHSKEKVSRPARENLIKVFRKVETSVFGRSTLRIQEDIPNIPPMSSFNDVAGIVTLSPQTLDSLNQKLSHPSDGAAFIVAHEIGHLVQDDFIDHNPKKLSPDGLKKPTSQDDQAFNDLHAETDCIAVEIYHQAGYPITDDIFKTLQIIKDECKTQRELAFCNAADEVRQSTVRKYIERYYGSNSQKSEASSTAGGPQKAKSNSSSAK